MPAATKPTPKKAKKKLAPAAPAATMPPAQPKAKRGRRLRVTADLAHGGLLSVRHLSDRDVHLDGVTVSLGDEPGKPVWIQLAKTGAFRGHAAGPFELNATVFSEIIANFRATENRAIPIDFEHASESDPTLGSIPTEGAPAQGWIRDLKVQAGNLWGLVEWGERAREYIRTGAYRFFSPAIRFGARDRVTGKAIGARMTSGALTNNPFLDGMAPLVAKDAPGSEPPPAGAPPAAVTMSLAHTPGEYMPSLRSALCAGELSTAADCLAQLELLREHLEAAGGNAEGTHEGIALSRFLYPLRNIVGARPGDTWDDVLDTVEALLEAAADPDGDGDAEGDDDGDGDGRAMTDNQPGEPPATNDGGPPAVETNAMFKDLTEATAKFSDLQAKSAEQQLKLRDETARADKAEAELVTLREEKTKREERELSERVDLAFETYKDARKLTDADKDAMLIVLRAKPETFEKQYPKVQPSQQHLMRNLTDHREKGAPPAAVIDPPKGPSVEELQVIAGETFSQTVTRVMRDQKVSYEAATTIAHGIRRQA